MSEKELLGDIEHSIRRIDSLEFIPATQIALKESRSKSMYFDEHHELLYYKLDDVYVVMFHPRWRTVTETVSGLYIFLISVGLVPSFIFLSILLAIKKRQSKSFMKMIIDSPKISNNFTSLPEFGRYIKNQIDSQRRTILKTSELQRDLMHGIAHEIKGPLSRINFSLEEMSVKCNSEDIGIIQKSLDELDNMASELLVYSRFEFNENLVLKKSVDLHELIEESMSKASYHYPKINFSCKNTSAKINCNYELFERALFNILKNCGRFAKSKCRISVVKGKYRIDICIEDDGCGIPPGRREDVFKPFIRYDQAYLSDSAGVGLGLAICHSIIKRHNGSVTISESQLGGALFHISIPN
ncbi:sensor histidine kinase [Pseudoalteromonas luteoviolacea]|nr:ATP-binding protein [Pseudoalteromonas luteoviolacea]